MSRESNGVDIAITGAERARAAQKKSLAVSRAGGGALLSQPPVVIEGQPLMVALELIDEDPNQPRTADNPGFSEASLLELSGSIARRGVKTPLSIRKHPDRVGRYLINHGARRYRAAKLAEKHHIPAFIDQDYTEFDQVVENLHRNALTAREIADFIGREVAKGHKKGDIAERIGKSNAFVSQHLALLDLPEPIANAFAAGRVQDVTAVNELVKLYAKKATEVDEWLKNPETEVTRSSLKTFRTELEDIEELSLSTKRNPHQEPKPDTAQAEAGEGVETARAKREKTHPAKLRKAIVLLKHRGKEGRLLYDRRPESRGQAWIRYEDGGTEASVELSSVKLVGLLEG